MARKNDSLRAECRKLRLMSRMGTTAISERMDVAVGTVAKWLYDIPLTKEERSAASSANARKASAGLRLSCDARGMTDELRDECIRLRTEEGWSIPRLAKEKRLSKGTLAYWFRDISLTDEQKSAVMANRPPRLGRKIAVMPPAKMNSKQSQIYRRQHTARIGFASETAIVAKLAHRMWIGLMPGAECANKSDIIASPGFHCRSIVRVQIKTLKWPENGFPSIRLSNGGTQVGPKRKVVRRYQPTDFDILIGYLPESDIAYVLNWDDIGDKKYCIAVNPDYAEAWHKLEAFFTQEEMDGQQEYWDSLATDDED